jgi:hypothetical protein
MIPGIEAPIFWITLCRSRGHLTWTDPRWTKRPYGNFDGVWFLCILGIPLVPLRVAHVYYHRFTRLKREYEEMPIRWSPGLVAFAWLRRGSLVAACYGIGILGLALFALTVRDDPDLWVAIYICVGLIAAWPLVWIALWLVDRRNRTIRTIMGSWDLGSSDPVTYVKSWISEGEYGKPRQHYEADTWAQGSLNCMDARIWSGALWAARMCILMEDPRVGRELTAVVLSNPEVRAALPKIRGQWSQWYELLGPSRYDAEQKEHAKLLPAAVKSPAPETSPREPGVLRWKQLASGKEGPGVRSRHCLVYDASRGVTVFFGGFLLDGKRTRVLADTWEWSNGQWSPIECSPAPGGRHRAGMVFDERHGFSVLFGGQANSNNLLDATWVYENRRWQKRRRWLTRRPSPRCGHAMAFDPEAGVTVLFGGLDLYDNSLSDTWLFDGDGWRQARGPGPPARRYAAFAYDPQSQGCILHGGSKDEKGFVRFGDTWLFREGAWTRLPETYETDSRDDHALAYHAVAKRLVMVGGLGAGSEVRGLSDAGWEMLGVEAPLPEHQCAPLAWDPKQNGLILHGGELGPGGAQLDTTWMLE